MQTMARKATGRDKWPELLSGFREEHDLTQEAAAAKVGVTRRAWIAWEHGETVPSTSTAILLRLLLQHPELF